MASRRMERVSRLLKQEISRVILSQLNDPRMGFVTVVKVEPTPDLKSAKVFVSVLGKETVISRTMHGLRHAAGFIRRTVAEGIELKNVPSLQFVEDDSVKRSVRISRIISGAVGREGTGEEPPVSENE